MAGIAKADLTPHCPIPSPATLARGLRTGSYAVTGIGLERRCSNCSDYWPADTEFFWSSPGTGAGLHCWCKACYSARMKAKAA